MYVSNKIVTYKYFCVRIYSCMYYVLMQIANVEYVYLTYSLETEVV